MIIEGKDYNRYDITRCVNCDAPTEYEKELDKFFCTECSLAGRTARRIKIK